MVASYCRCKQCGTVLQSLHVYDYKKCGCPNEAMVDGGLEYQRYGGMDMKMVEPYAVYTDDPYDTVRQHCYRLGYGKNGNEAFRITRLFEMTDGHLNALLEYPCPEWQRELVKMEIEYRKSKGISVED